MTTSAWAPTLTACQGTACFECVIFLIKIFVSRRRHVCRTPEGLEDASKYPNLFAALLEDSEIYWSRADLGKLASANLIRVFKEVENVRDALQMVEQPYQNLVPVKDLGRNTFCMSQAGLSRA